jgi:hypothetical protein
VSSKFLREIFGGIINQKPVFGNNRKIQVSRFAETWIYFSTFVGTRPRPQIFGSWIETRAHQRQNLRAFRRDVFIQPRGGDHRHPRRDLRVIERA